MAAVVLVHYGKPDLTRRCLESLRSQEPAPHRVIVVDHGPSQGLEEALAGAHPRLTLLKNHANPGFAAGCNLGASQAFQEGAPAVWFLNNDATLEGPTLAPLLDLARQHPDVALWGLHQRDGERLVGADLQPAWFAGELPAPRIDLPPYCRLLPPRETLSGATILITRDHWLHLGGWPEEFFLYLEDAAWCLRAHALGLPVVLCESSVIHPRSSTTGRRSPLSIFYGVRNQLLLHRQLHPGDNAGRCGMAFHMLQKRFFQGRWRLLAHTLKGILAARAGNTGRDPRY